MNAMCDNTRKAIDIFKSELVVGNHDTITLFGNQAQMRIKDYSSTVSKMLQRSNDELELAIEETVSGIDNLNLFASKRKRKLFDNFIYHRGVVKEYRKIALYIERVSEMLMLQQAQTLKEIKLLEKLAISVDESAIFLETCINTGKSVLSNRNSVCRCSTNQFPLCSSNLDSDEIDNWYLRLERRINDLCVTHTIALQNRTQILLLKNSNLALLDTISSAISNALPLWQNQMATILSVERLNIRLKERTHLTVSERGSQPSMVDDADKFHRDKEYSAEDILVSNKGLKESLKKTASIEKQYRTVREEIRIEK